MKKTQENSLHEQIIRNHHMRRSAGLISLVGMAILLALLIFIIS